MMLDLDGGINDALRRMTVDDFLGAGFMDQDSDGEGAEGVDNGVCDGISLIHSRYSPFVPELGRRFRWRRRKCRR